MAHADERYRGVTMATHALIGFTGGILGPFAAGLALDLGGGIELDTAWRYAIMSIAIGPALSAIAMILLVAPKRKKLSTDAPQ